MHICSLFYASLECQCVVSVMKFSLSVLCFSLTVARLSAAFRTVIQKVSEMSKNDTYTTLKGIEYCLADPNLLRRF